LTFVRYFKKNSNLGRKCRVIKN